MAETTFVDVSNTVNQPYTTGIQRVVREIARAAVGRGAALVEFSTATGRWHAVDPATLDPPHLGSRRHATAVRARRMYRSAVGTTGVARAVRHALNVMPARAEGARRLLAGRRIGLGTPVDVDHARLLLPEITSSARHARKLHGLSAQGSVHVSAFVHDLFPLTNPEWFPPDPRHHFAEYLEVVAAADRVATASEFVMSEVRSAGVAGEGRVLRLPAGQLPSGGAPAAGHAAAPYLLSVGSLEPRKNHAGLLAAVARLAQDGVPVRLVLVSQVAWGSSGFGAAVARARDCGADVTILTDIDDDRLVELYAGATATVYPSFAEGYGLPVVESLACGTPVITSRTSALVEFASVGGVVLVDPGDTDALTDAIRGVLDPRGRQALVAGLHVDRVPVGWDPWAQRLWAWLIDGG